MSSFDTPSTEQVLQIDNADVDDTIIVPVEVQNAIRIDTMPSRLSAIRRIYLNTAAEPEQVATEDPRRKRITLTAFNNDVIVSSSHGECSEFQGYIIQSGFGIPHHFDFASELWVRPVAIDTTGTNIVFAASTDAAILSVIIEQWAR